MTMKKKKYNARFPPARIKKIMQTDEDVGKVAQPVPVIISRALELFVENLLKKANDITTQRGARTLTPSHLKMCIKSEKRFDFLKELVSAVPDLQGDHDDPQGVSTGASGLDLSMSALQAPNGSVNSSDLMTTNTSNALTGSIAASVMASASVRPNKLPRQLSTPRPRGRPRTVSVDSDHVKIPKKRRKKRQPRFVDDDVDEASDEDDDGSNGTPPGSLIAAPTATSTTAAVSYYDENQSGANQKSNTLKFNNDQAVVTCTVTTGLTPHINGFGNGSTSNSGLNNGGGLGFTLSIPSTSLLSAPPMASPGTTSSPLSMLNSNGYPPAATPGATVTKPGGGIKHTKENTSYGIKTENLALNAHNISNYGKIEQKAKSAAVQDVDEDYDDC